MAIRDLRFYGDPVLRTAATPIEKFDAALHRLAQDMLETMDAAGGVGLAANQIGVLKRIFVYDCSHFQAGLRGAIINPEWEPLTQDIQVGKEGCLSIPDISADTPRYNTVKVTGFDVSGRPVAMVVSGLMARCVQHETDHLDGVLFLQKLQLEEKTAAYAQLRSSDWFTGEAQN